MENTVKTIEELREGGKYEVKKLELSGNSLTVRADFNLLRKAYGVLINSEMDAKEGMKVSMDLMGAGDKLLFMGAVSAEEKEVFMSNAKLRFKACQELGMWVAELMGDDVEEEKKS